MFSLSHPKVSVDSAEPRSALRYHRIVASRFLAQGCLNKVGKQSVKERHRHRYEVNPSYVEALEAAGLRVAGTSKDQSLVEMIEVIDHPWFVACQFHPEFKSKPFQPHPLFVQFIKASSKKS